MSRIKQDPETYFTKAKIPYMPKVGGVEERLEGRVGFHEFELCLIRTHWMTERYLNNQSNVDRIDALNHLMSLKADIMRYCLPHGLDWKQIMDEKRGYLVVTPNHQSHMYYRLMSNNLLILDDSQVTRFLDFHLVNAILKHQKKKDFEGTKFDEAYIRFIQELDYQVTFNLKHEVPVVRLGVIDELRTWVRKHMDAFSKEQLIKYHEYDYDREVNREKHPYESLVQSTLKTGCPAQIIKLYFNLLTKSNPEKIGVSPFVNEIKVKQILSKWFDIGASVDAETDHTITINRKQLLFHLYQFKKHFCVSRRRGMVQNENLIRLAFEEFPQLFEGVQFSSQLDNFKRDSEKGYHRSLDFKEYADLKKSQENFKKP